jgi:hypothetical protein
MHTLAGRIAPEELNRTHNELLELVVARVTHDRYPELRSEQVQTDARL